MPDADVRSSGSVACVRSAEGVACVRSADRGPRRLHILLLDDDAAALPGP
jgi:hypothetical protein